MNIVLWIAQAVLAAIMVAAGAPKLFFSRKRLADKMGWTRDTNAALVRLLGMAELLSGVGVVLPRLTGVAPILTPIAPIGLPLILVGALTTKLRHHESPALPLAAMLLAVLIGVGRMVG